MVRWLIIQLQTMFGVRYSLQVATDLVSQDWMTIMTGIVGTGEIQDLLVPTEGATLQMYRLLVE